MCSPLACVGDKTNCSGIAVLICGGEVTRIYGRAVKTAMCVEFGGATGAMGVHEFGIAETKNPITVPNNSEGTIRPKQESKPARSSRSLLLVLSTAEKKATIVEGSAWKVTRLIVVRQKVSLRL